jgi:SAM-dependent methyltransferase
MNREELKAVIREVLAEEKRTEFDPKVLEGKTILHMGCGETRVENAVNVDYIKTDATDVVFNLETVPWDWAPDEFFEHIEAVDIIEHFVHVIPVINEMYRVLKPGGTIHIHTTHWQTPNSFTDPSHFHYFTEHSFDYWDPATFMGGKYGWYRANSGVMKVQHAFRHGQELDVLLYKPKGEDGK